MRSLRFGVERHGDPITAYPLKTLHSGITVQQGFGGLVSEIELRAVARFSGYTWRQWEQLPQDDKVQDVAYQRIRRAIDANEEDARDKAIARAKPKKR